VLKDSPILVMDEPVSNLDAESEAELTAAMAKARRGRTVLVIAHRLSTIRTADRLVVLERGRVSEIGRHDELLGRRRHLRATDRRPARRWQAWTDRPRRRRAPCEDA
jgi:ABC-type multidrug transport system fused ATPase/permease subunit